jgi:ankyrin repeat protein
LISVVLLGLVACADRFGLVEAVNGRDEGRVKQQLKDGAPPGQIDETGRPIIMSVLDDGGARIAMMLLDAGADASVSYQGTPLLVMATAKTGCSPKIVRLLVEHGADPNSTSKMTGGSALLEAARFRNEGCVDVLLKLGASPRATDLLQANGVWMGALSGSATIVGEFIKRGADPGAPDKFGVTPLMVAATAGTVDVVDRLLAADVAQCVRDSRGRTAKEMAQAKNHAAVDRRLHDCP